MPPEEPDFFMLCARSGRFVFTSRFFHYPFPARSDPNFGSGGTSPPGAIRQLRLAPWFVVFLTFSSVSGMFTTMISLHLTGSGVISTPILADGKLIVPLVNCHNFHGGAVGQDLIQMVKATPDEKCVQLGVFNPNALCSMTSPALAGGKLFLRLEDRVACYDLRAK
jgi:hypothetical protein